MGMAVYAGDVIKPPDCWDIYDIAKHFSVSISTVRRWISNGRLKPIKRHGSKDRLLFKIDYVRAYTPPPDKRFKK
ncbi:MAG: helix-turn-helix domain-containing protein [Thiothrix sp.]|uniref:helix-turn-helix domain-containing protein n=1 Tax=Thiothrix sp. TaxID=1032 RepID=UPI002631B712|nr:helix-turn-helix domain-containing protein [Thiothrix sp.]MDD5395172.1 helix-turn-helix domain-containing protein [Thiothrix sp.]